MKTFVVALFTFMDSNLIQEIVKANNKYEAVGLFMIKISADEETKQSEIDWQQHEEYPDNYDHLVEHYFDADMVVNAIEVTE